MGPQKLPKIDQDAKKKVPRQFFDSQEPKNDDSGPTRKKRPKTATPKTWILNDFWSVLNDLLRGFCITRSCWHCTQQLHTKCILPSVGVVFRPFGKSRKTAQKIISFLKKKTSKTEAAKKLPKTSIFEAFRGCIMRATRLTARRAEPRVL